MSRKKRFFYFMQWQLSICIGIAFFMILSGCQKEGTKVPIQDSFKKWTLFNPGSYWIYFNEQTRKLDSAYVNSNQLEYFYPPDKDKIHYEIIRYNAVNLAEFTLSARTDDSFLLCEGSAGHDFIFSYRVSANISQKLNSIDKCKIIFTKVFIQRLFGRFKTEGFSGSVV